MSPLSNCERPAVSRITTPKPPFSAFSNACRASSGGFTPASNSTGTSRRSPNCWSCCTAAGRYGSAATSMTRSPFERSSFASLPAVVVLPEPCKPISMIVRGLGPVRLRGAGSPRVAISSSLTILMTCCPGLSALETSAPTARSRMRATRVLTTLKCTSASRSARRTSRMAESTSASESFPRRRSWSKTWFRRLLRFSNMVRYCSAADVSGQGKCAAGPLEARTPQERGMCRRIFSTDPARLG